MRICLITPAPPGSRHGNRVTALRWARILRALGHHVTIRRSYGGERCDLMVALHARLSHSAMARFRRESPEKPLILALTGTDLYRDLPRSLRARRSLAWATRLVVLQPMALRALGGGPLRAKARVIYQSVRMPHRKLRRIPSAARAAPFEVCVIGHLRPVKDPFRTALAAKVLPASSRIRVLHLGRALSEAMAERARREMARNPRYQWLGERPRPEALRLLARSRLLVVSSRMEGGANVVSEAAAAGVPILSSRIDGSIGLLGGRYPGYFPVGDARALARLLHRAETDAAFYSKLRRWCARLAPLFDPAREARAWQRLLRELTTEPSRPRASQ